MSKLTYIAAVAFLPAIIGCGPSRSELIAVYNAERDELARIEAEVEEKCEQAHDRWEAFRNDEKEDEVSEEMDRVRTDCESLLVAQRAKVDAAKKAAGIGVMPKN